MRTSTWTIDIRTQPGHYYFLVSLFKTLHSHRNHKIKMADTRLTCGPCWAAAWGVKRPDSSVFLLPPEERWLFSGSILSDLWMEPKHLERRCVTAHKYGGPLLPRVGLSELETLVFMFHVMLMILQTEAPPTAPLKRLSFITMSNLQVWPWLSAILLLCSRFSLLAQLAKELINRWWHHLLWSNHHSS